jgi:hypothetical protein
MRRPDPERWETPPRISPENESVTRADRIRIGKYDEK